MVSVMVRCNDGPVHYRQPRIATILLDPPRLTLAISYRSFAQLTGTKPMSATCETDEIHVRMERCGTRSAIDHVPLITVHFQSSQCIVRVRLLVLAHGNKVRDDTVLSRNTPIPLFRFTVN
jgi:hypothetical protein